MYNNKHPGRRHGALGRRQLGHIGMLYLREIPGITYPSSLVQCTTFEPKVSKHHFDGSKNLLWESTTLLHFPLDSRNTYFACLPLLTVTSNLELSGAQAVTSLSQATEASR